MTTHRTVTHRLLAASGPKPGYPAGIIDGGDGIVEVPGERLYAPRATISTAIIEHGDILGGKAEFRLVSITDPTETEDGTMTTYEKVRINSWQDCAVFPDRSVYSSIVMGYFSKTTRTLPPLGERPLGE